MMKGEGCPAAHFPNDLLPPMQIEMDMNMKILEELSTQYE